MKRLVGVIALAMLVPLPAMALGSFGVRVGGGFGMPNDDAGGDDVSISNFAIGAGWKMALPLITLEVDALYHRSSASLDFAGSKDITLNSLALPVLARTGIPLVPLLSVGAGLEPRFPLSTDPEEFKDGAAGMTLFLPILLGANFELGGISAGVDIRYIIQLQAADEDRKSDGRVNELMFFGGAFF